MASAYNDNTLPYGSQILNINGVNYVAESIDVTRPTKKIKRYNQNGEPAGQVFVSDFDTGTATIQMANYTHTLPSRGMTFAANIQNVNATYVVSEVGTPLSQDEAIKVTISFDKVGYS